MYEVPSTPIARLLRFVGARVPRSLAPGVGQATRDASMLERRLLLGRAPSPLIKRPPRRSAPPAVAVAAIDPGSPAPVITARQGGAASITVVDGAARTVCVPSADQYVLHAALEAGASMPFSCALGGCGSCKVRLVEGTYEMDEPNCLSDEERSAGFVLTCVGRATSACTLEIVR